MRQRDRRGARPESLLAVLLAGVLAASGCSMFGEAEPPPVPAAEVTQKPGEGAQDVNPGQEVGLQVTDGKIQDVALNGPDGNPVPGEVTPDGRGWTGTEQLDYGTTYTWSGTARAADGKPTPIGGSFRTVSPEETMGAQFNIADGDEVGVAAPIILTFDGQVEDKAAVERKLEVRTEPHTEGSWAWLPDTAEGSRVHWRPKEYWKPGTQVDVDAKLLGVQYAPGVYGEDSATNHFTIGREQIVKADADSHQMVVHRDGEEVATYDASYGLDSDPDRNTRSGIHVVSELSPSVRMISEQYDYDEVHQWGVRISNNGEYIHSNPSTTGSQGSTNVSHGCINLSPANAQEFFNSSMYGDPVEVTGTSVQLSEADGDLWDWTVPWEEWQQMSALPMP